VVTALYRRYRPENFAEMIGQSQVTDPLMTALRTNRVNHAYLFSGPRGCGKTTSARILARCLNCAEGPTDTPCGVCPSCVELGRDGPGSLDVVEIDAASHNGVDDARDLRERAVFAPARDRFKIFILDEAHMVTPQGFNALLKIVEEPPEHIKFIFATTEPDKVIGTIRSRTHHYPFRLIPPAQLLEYVQHLCDTEGVDVAPGVLPLVVRAGGGSARDTLSLLDQLIAGSENNRVDYERAVALLGYTHGALLAEAIDALGAHDGAAAFDAVDRVIQTGQDPRRFVEDLLERLRDIIVVSATRESAASVLRGVPADEIEAMRRQAALFGHAELSRVADIVNTALSEMTGATSPRLHLELMIARALVPASDDTQRGALARVERLERRIGVDAPDAVGGSAPAAGFGAGADAGSGSGSGAGAGVPAARPTDPIVASTPAPATPVVRSLGGATGAATASAAAGDDAASRSGASPASAPSPGGAATGSPASASRGGARAASAEASSATSVPVQPTPDGAFSGNTASAPVPPAPGGGTAAVAAAAGEVSLQQLKDAWPEILEVVQKTKMTAWLVVYTAQVRALEGDVLTLAFPSENDVASFKERSAPGQGVSEFLRQAILDVLGLRVKYIARVDTSLRPHDEAAVGEPTAPASPVAAQASPASASASASPASVPASSAPAPASASDSASSPAPASSAAAPAFESPGSEPAPASVSPAPSPASPVSSASASGSLTSPASSPAAAPESRVPSSAPTPGAPSAAGSAPDAASGPAPASAEPADAGDDELDDEDDLPPEEDLPPEPRVIVDSAGWAVPGLHENSPLSAPVGEVDPASDSAEVARMRAQLASLTKGGAPSSPSQPARPAEPTASAGAGGRAPSATAANPAASAGETAATRPSGSAAAVTRPSDPAASATRPAGAATSAGATPANPVAPAGPTGATAPSPAAGPAGGPPAGAQRPAGPPRDPRQTPDAATRRPAAPTTTWDVVAIPTSSDEEPPPFDEPMPSDEPDLPADRGNAIPGESTAFAPGSAVPQQNGRPDQATRPATPASPVASGSGAPAAPIASAAPGNPRGINPNVSPSRAVPPSGRAPQFGEASNGGTDAAATPASPAAPAAASGAATPRTSPTPPAPGGRARYGEAVVREILGANFIEEQPLPGREG
jgi:DNA polymerase-3 subunit gamma/tau